MNYSAVLPGHQRHTGLNLNVLKITTGVVTMLVAAVMTGVVISEQLFRMED